MSDDLLRHLLAAVAYRFHAAIGNCAPTFADFVPEGAARSPRDVLAHCVYVLRLARSTFEPASEPTAPFGASWDEMAALFHDELVRLDHHLECAHATHTWTLEQLVQGPFADVLTHIGQLAMLRRMSGDPVPPQSYLRAQVRAGRVGPDQEPPVPRS